MDRKEMIQKLKQNEKPFGLLAKEEQDELRQFPHDAEMYCDESWGCCREGYSFDSHFTYRLRPDYTEPEDEVERCEVFVDNGKLFYGNPNYPKQRLHKAVDDANFIQYDYGNGVVSSYQTRKYYSDVMPAEYPKYVLFRRKK